MYQLYTAKGLHKQFVLTTTQFDILFLQAVLRYSCSSGWFDCALCNCLYIVWSCKTIWRWSQKHRKMSVNSNIWWNTFHWFAFLGSLHCINFVHIRWNLSFYSNYYLNCRLQNYETHLFYTWSLISWRRKQQFVKNTPLQTVSHTWKIRSKLL